MMTSIYPAQLLTRLTVRNRIVLALWFTVVAAAVVRVSVMLSNPILPGEFWRGSSGYFLDYRDTIWTPGQFLLAGGNPYDPETYQAVYPWALAFSLYAPAWLLLAAALAPLPYLVSVIVFQVIALGVAVVMLRVICRWALPALADVAVPAGLLWMHIWYPGRGSLSVQLSTLLAVLGVALVLRSITSPEVPIDGPAGADLPWRRNVVDRACAVGVALGLVKPQFGTIAVIGLAGGRPREVWRGIAGLILVSMPVLIVCSVATGGPIEFVRSVLRDLDVANSAHHPSGLAFPDQRRLDLLGQLARYGLDDPPRWLQAGVLVLALVVVPVVIVRLTRNPLLVSAVVCPSLLIGIYHGTYDLLILLIPVAVGIGMLVRGELTGIAERITLGALVLIVVHLHSVSTRLIPGFDVRAADTVDLALMMIGLVCGMYSAVSAATARSGRRECA
jgi:hypothetical protein